MFMLNEEQEEPPPLPNRLLHQIVPSPSSWRPSGAGRGTSDRHTDIPESFSHATDEHGDSARPVCAFQILTQVTSLPRSQFGLLSGDRLKPITKRHTIHTHRILSKT